MPAHDAAVSLAAEGVFASSGDFYATTVVERLGFAREGLLRVGLSIYSTASEVERVLAGVDRAATRRRDRPSLAALLATT